MKKILKSSFKLVSVIIIGLAFSVIQSCGEKAKENTTDRTIYTDTISVESYSVVTRELAISRTFSGTLEGEEQANIIAKIAERIMSIKGAAVVLLYLLPIGFFPLSEPDEARYGEIAREMLTRGDWVTPTCNYVRYFEKPPLVYWLTAATFSGLGISEFAARLWPALFGLLGIATAGLLGRAMYGPWVGVVAAGVLAACPYYFGLSQALVLDVPLAALVAVAHGAFWAAYVTAVPWQRRAAVLALAVATALAVLTKGPVAGVLVGGRDAVRRAAAVDDAATAFLQS